MFYFEKKFLFLKKNLAIYEILFLFLHRFSIEKSRENTIKKLKFIMKQEDFKTEHQRKREERENAIYAEYMALTADQNKSKMAINEYLMKKYEIYGASTLYAIVRRAKERLSNTNS